MKLHLFSSSNNMMLRITQPSGEVALSIRGWGICPCMTDEIPTQPRLHPLVPLTVVNHPALNIISNFTSRKEARRSSSIQALRDSLILLQRVQSLLVALACQSYIVKVRHLHLLSLHSSNRAWILIRGIDILHHPRQCTSQITKTLGFPMVHCRIQCLQA